MSWALFALAGAAGLAGAVGAVSRRVRGPLSAAALLALMPRLPPARAAELLPHLNEALREAGATTPRRLAAFLAQLAVESAELRYFEEVATGAAYEGRQDLGNTQPGDGPRYKGRGPLQLTGRANYRAAGRTLGLPLEERPELAALPSAGFRVAAWFWRSRGLNALADLGTEAAFRDITRRINGGLNGLEHRLAYWRRFLAMLGGQV